MIKSAYRYFSMFLKVLVDRDIRKLVLRKPNSIEIKDVSSAIALSNWLIGAQKIDSDGGYRTYYLDTKWTSSYPETSGYIIPVLLEASKKLHSVEYEKSALIAAEWLLSIQKKEGGWQGGYIHQNRPAIVFNTGQIIRGMLAAFEFTENVRYLESAIRAGNWLTSIQNKKGYWENYVYLNRIRVYDTYVAAPLALLYKATGNEDYKRAAIAQCEWVINEKQQKNGWFSDADNTIKHNDRPILHTLAYTIDGLIETGILLEREDFIKAALIPSKILAGKWELEKCFHGRYNSNWIGSEALITTGSAQIAISFLRLNDFYKDPYWRDMAREILDFLKSIQIIDSTIKEVRGGIFGSFPVWGQYEAFGLPNWANKYFLEGLLMVMPSSGPIIQQSKSTPS